MCGSRYLDVLLQCDATVHEFHVWSMFASCIISSRKPDSYGSGRTEGIYYFVLYRVSHVDDQ